MITNEQIQQALLGIETLTETEIRKTLNALLMSEGYPSYHANGIFNPHTNLYEGVILTQNGSEPVIHFTYDWDTNEWNTLK